MNTPHSDDPLGPLLDRWSNIPPPSPRLTAEIWQQIATAETHRNADRSIWASIGLWLERPAYAVGFIAACALLGVVLAELRISQIQRERNAQLARSYLQLIDPLSVGTEPRTRS